MSWIAAAHPFVFLLLSLGLLLGAAEVGYRRGAGHAPADDRLHGQSGAVQAAVLGLLGLLLAFSFSMSVERYETRRALVVKEANAIGTAYLRTEALDGPQRDEARALFRRYVDARLAFFDAGDDAVAIAGAVGVADGLQGELWRIGAGAALAEPTSLPRALLLEALNDVIDVSAEREAALEAHVPRAILGMIVLVAAAGLGMVGFSYGLFRGPHRPGGLLLAALVGLLLYAVLDLDAPRTGRIRVSQVPMQELKAQLAE